MSDDDPTAGYDHTPGAQTFWNGEPCKARRVLVVVADAAFPLYWARRLVGKRRRAVEISNANQHGKQPFYIDDEDGHGWIKVTTGRGLPGWRHADLAISEVVEEFA